MHQATSIILAVEMCVVLANPVGNALFNHHYCIGIYNINMCATLTPTNNKTKKSKNYSNAPGNRHYTGLRCAWYWQIL